MSIWFKKYALSDLNALVKNTMVEYVAIEFTEMGEDYLAARMPIDSRTVQPQRILHGGASCVLAETIASVAANCCVDPAQYYCVGLDLNINHIRSVSSGFVIGTTRPLHIGKSTQVWNIEINNESGKLVAVSRLTMAVLQQK